MTTTARLVLDADALRRVRLGQALSQAALGEKAGVREATVNAAEQGARCRPSTIRALADALAVDVAAIASVEVS